MAGGKRAYIERRIETLVDRSRWLRTAILRPDAQDWWSEELADYDRRIAHYKAKLTEQDVAA